MAGKDTTKKLLSVYGITSFNKWIRLPQITIIFLDQDANFFIDNKRQIFYFDMNDEILYYSEDDKYEKETVLKSGLLDYKISGGISMSNIAGFISSSIMGPFGSYIKR